jgi:CheY-specific phosphatase CheX
MLIEANDVTQITHEIWGGMLQIELSPLPDIPIKFGIGACVEITGAWEGAVRVDCSKPLAKLATARFLGVKPEEVALDQMRDAMGELANMSAGIVKPLLPPPCRLSQPTVDDGCDHNSSVPHNEVLLISAFEYEGEPVKITILQKRF